MLKEPSKYEEWLTTIATTRLIYNTLDELENLLDNHSIHSNGIKRCFPTQQKLRSAYRDLKVEVELMTDGIVNLDRLITHYRRAWLFFRENLYRRTNPEQTAIELLSFCYPPYLRNGLIAGKRAIYEQVIEQDINVPFLILMLMKVVPGYDSRDGDVTDMPTNFERVMKLLEGFTGSSTAFSLLPTITKAREEENKSRLMLLFHTSQILDAYESFSDPSNLYDTSRDVKDSSHNIDIAGFWNECGGKLLYTDFWQIEDALEYGTYFMTRWHKDSENRLTGTRYTLLILKGPDGNLIYYLLHPEAIKHRMKGLAYGDSDHVWYRTGWLEDRPPALPLQRLMFSTAWPSELNLTRCTDEEVLSQYRRWLNRDCEIVKPYGHLEYEFQPSIYAITPTHLYISSENEGEYYKVPKSAHEGFERIQTYDNVGTMSMNGKTYLAFDELMLYIGTGKKELQRYGIERVRSII